MTFRDHQASAFYAFATPTSVYFTNIVRPFTHTAYPSRVTPASFPLHTRQSSTRVHSLVPTKVSSTFATMTVRHDINLGDVAANLGEYVTKISSEAIEARGRFSVAISGGSLPKQLAQGLESSLTTIDFEKWDVFLADERIVPPDHPDSNRHEILSRFPAMNITPVDHSLTPEKCAEQYQKTVCGTLGDSPVFDAVLLGLGPDGHTCSLFPGHPLLQETERVVAPIIDSPKPPPNRVTLTFPVLNAARAVIFVCTGDSKAPVIRDIIEGSDCELPGALVRPSSGHVIWFLDNPAASQLRECTLAKS